MRSARQIFLNADVNFVQPLKVVIHSLLKTINPQKSLTVHIAHDDSFRGQGHEREISCLFERFPFANVVFHDFTPIFARHRSQLEFPECRWPPMLWAFPLFTELIPDLCGKILYLDVDMLICKDVSPLFDLQLSGCGYIAAAVNEGTHEEFIHLEKHGWPKDAGSYINNGTLLVDADAYRRENIADRMARWYADNRNGAWFVDQDAQNVFLGSRTLRLPMKWNYNDVWLEQIRKFNSHANSWDGHRPQDVLEAALDPCIIHFMNRNKPWNFTHRPERNRYRAAMREIGLGLDPLPGETPLRKLEGIFFDSYHALLKRYTARRLRELKGITCPKAP